MDVAVEPSKQEVLDFFFEASMATYAGGASKGTIVELPGSRVLVYERPPYRYVDCCFSVGENSFGQTGIWHQALLAGPVWGMQYRGWCTDKRVIPFLKQALLAAYEQRIFLGGRGPQSFRVEEETLAYHNHPNRAGAGGFTDSRGEEEIYDTAGVSRALFRHEYDCFALVRLS